jgi:hypothetical protein
MLSTALDSRFENRMPVHISPVRIRRIKERWERGGDDLPR